MTQKDDRYLKIPMTNLDGVCITDKRGNFLEVNNAYCQMSGYGADELCKMHLTDLDTIETPASFARHMALIRRKGEDRFETTHRRKDGTLFDVEVTIQQLHRNEGGYAVFLRDITSRKQAEESLRQSELFTKAILDNLPVGIAVNSIDPAVSFQYMNDNFPRFYRTTREQLAEPDSFWEAVYEDPEYREQIRKRVLDDCAAGDPKKMYWRNIPLTRNGEPTSFITACNIPVPDEKLMISMVWDVTETKLAEDAREKLQQQLRQAQKMESVGRLAGGIAHDFNNMLGVILGHTELAMERFDPSDPVQEDLVQIQTAAGRSAELTRQLLAFARKQTVEPQVLDINEVISNLLKMLRRLIGEDIELEWIPRSGIWPVKLDPVQLDQILTNLFVNASDAISNVGKITIETTNIELDHAYSDVHAGFIPGEYALLTVNDNGCGIEKNYLSKIFEPFFTTKELGKGTGLGLATVYGIVKQNNGFINVYSEIGKGTSFKIYLPRYKGKKAPIISKKTTGNIVQGHETVLLVEDEPALLELIKRMLENLGYTVLATTSPVKAIQLAEEYPGTVHLLITDLIMPEMNGRDLSDKLFSRQSDIKCLYMSGYTANVIAHHGVLDEGIYFIQKPFSSQNLAAKIREILGS